MKMITKARRAWGDAMPDWVATIAVRADATSQTAVGRLLGVSQATVSTIVANKYPADTFEMEQRVRTRLEVTPVAVVRAGWGDAMPDWVQALADECARSSQGEAGRKLRRYSASVVNQVLSNTYKGNVRRIEYQVRGLIMQQTVNCPVMYEPITHASCVYAQETSFDQRLALPGISLAFRRACPTCPHFLKKK